ncbi:MAG: ATP-dependent RecD-like DNA helicase [Thermovenabulum sp.]|uniref:SF1B family DNA helicase RecD2 n=1 Tax=Thermovenabulum sp. TaxID=3100335 RepID=UPI003C7D01F1
MEQLYNVCIDRIIFYNPVTNYTVASIKTEDNRKLMATFKGDLKEGEKIIIVGNWVNHQKYGLQFQGEYVTKFDPEKIENGTIHFLSEINHIGQARASEIVKELGINALYKISKEPLLLSKVKIPLKAKEEVLKALQNDDKILRYIKMNLLPLGISANIIEKAYKTYGAEAEKILLEKPYKIAGEVKKVGAKKAERIAQTINYDNNSEKLAMIINYIIKQKSDQNGHLYVTLEELRQEISDAYLMDITQRELSDFIQENMTNLSIIQDNKIYKKRDLIDEQIIASGINAMVENYQFNIFKNYNDLDNFLETMPIKYTDEQKAAIKEAIQSSISVITGGPGTGKTTIIKAIIDYFAKKNETVELAAPTGKASKRLTEATGYRAQTIHRLLEAAYDEKSKKVYFGRNKYNPIYADVVIIDESSMIDNFLMARLVEALDYRNTRLILVGDADQLPSVGPGNILRDIISSGVVNVSRLSKVFRQTDQGTIKVNAHLINMGKYPKFNQSDFIFKETEDPEDVVKEYIKNIQENGISSVQLISPMKKGIFGTEKLNKMIQEKVNPNNYGIKIGENVFRIGDRIIQNSNNYRIGIFNGDTGVIKDIIIARRDKDQEYNIKDVIIIAEFDGEDKEIIGEEIKQISLAYSITVHKSQGSEYDTIILVLKTGHYVMLNRNLLYTAVTRAKKKVIIMGDKKAIALALHTTDNIKRNTGLKEILSNKEMVLRKQVGL